MFFPATLKSDSFSSPISGRWNSLEERVSSLLVVEIY